MTEKLEKRRRLRGLWWAICIGFLCFAGLLGIYLKERSRCLDEVRKVSQMVEMGISRKDVESMCGRPYVTSTGSAISDDSVNYDYSIPYWWTLVWADLFSSTRTEFREPYVQTPPTCRVIFLQDKVASVLLRERTIGNVFVVVKK